MVGNEGRFVPTISHHSTLSLTPGSLEDSIVHVLSFSISHIMQSIIQCCRVQTLIPTANAVYADLLTHQDTPVPHLAVAKCLHRVLNALAIQGEHHTGRDNLLLSSKLK